MAQLKLLSMGSADAAAGCGVDLGRRELPEGLYRLYLGRRDLTGTRARRRLVDGSTGLAIALQRAAGEADRLPARQAPADRLPAEESNQLWIATVREDGDADHCVVSRDYFVVHDPTGIYQGSLPMDRLVDGLLVVPTRRVVPVFSLHGRGYVAA